MLVDYLFLGSVDAVDGGLEGVVEVEGMVEVVEGLLFVAHQFVGATAVDPGFGEGAVALDGMGEVVDGLFIVAVGEELDVAAVMPRLFVVGVDVEDLLV